MIKRSQSLQPLPDRCVVPARPERDDFSEPGNLTRHAEATQSIGVAIIRGTFPPGTSLPIEHESQSRFGISRSSYREVIQSLAAKGMVKARRKLGTRVTPRSSWNILDPALLGWMRESKPDGKFISDIFESWAIIGPGAAALAADRIGEDELERLSAAMTGLISQVRLGQHSRKAVHQFHECVLRASGNEAIFATLPLVSASLHWLHHFKSTFWAFDARFVEDHRQIYDAIRRKDRGAAHWSSRSLIENAMAGLRKYLDLLE